MKTIKYVFSVLTLIISIAYIYYNRDKIHLLTTISSQNILILLSLGFLSLIPVAFHFRIIMKIFGVNLTITEWFGLSVANTMYSYYMPARGGLVIRALYLKAKYNFSYAKYIALTSGAIILNLLSASLSCFLFSLTYYFVNNILYTEIIIISLILSCSLLIMSMILLNLKKKSISLKNQKIRTIVINTLDGIRTFYENPGSVIYIVFVQFLALTVMSFRLYWSFTSIGIKTDFLQILIIQSLVSFSLVLSLTPGNLGIKEGIVGMFANILGVPLSDAILGAALDRIIAIIVTFIFGLIFSHILLRDLDYSPSQKLKT